MAIIPSLPVTLQNGTTADATQVMANFNAIVSAVNAGAANAGINTNISQLLGLTIALSPSQGGTGQQILTPNGVLIGEGTGPVNAIAPGAQGTVLISNGPGSDPSFGCPFRVGDLYITTLSSNPSSFYAGTTWAAYASGQVLIGVGSFTDGDGNSETISGAQQLGEYKHQLTTSELASHGHTDSGHSHTPAGGSHGTTFLTGGGTDQQGFVLAGSPALGNFANTASSAANIQNTGGNSSHNNIQPSIGVYIWLRTA